MQASAKKLAKHFSYIWTLKMQCEEEQEHDPKLSIEHVMSVKRRVCTTRQHEEIVTNLKSGRPASPKMFTNLSLRNLLQWSIEAKVSLTLSFAASRGRRASLIKAMQKLHYCVTSTDSTLYSRRVLLPLMPS